MRAKIIEDIIVLAAMVVMLVVGYLWADPINAVVQAAPAADGDVPPCEPWRKAGSVLIYRCADEETDDVCFSHQLGMMFCMKDY